MITINDDWQIKKLYRRLRLYHTLCVDVSIFDGLMSNTPVKSDQPDLPELRCWMCQVEAPKEILDKFYFITRRTK